MIRSSSPLPRSLDLNPNEPIVNRNEHYVDEAAGIQRVTEETLLEIVNYLQREAAGGLLQRVQSWFPERDALRRYLYAASGLMMNTAAVIWANVVYWSPRVGELKARVHL